MKINKISIIIGITGLIIILFSLFWGFKTINQYYFDYRDLSQLAIGVGLGLVFFFIGINTLWNAYIFNWMSKNQQEDMKINKRLDAVLDWWTKHEFNGENKR